MLLHVDIGDFVEGEQGGDGDCGDSGDWRWLTGVGSVSCTTVTYYTLLQGTVLYCTMYILLSHTISNVLSITVMYCTVVYYILL